MNRRDLIKTVLGAGAALAAAPKALAGVSLAKLKASPEAPVEHDPLAGCVPENTEIATAGEDLSAGELIYIGTDGLAYVYTGNVMAFDGPGGISLSIARSGSSFPLMTKGAVRWTVAP